MKWTRRRFCNLALKVSPPAMKRQKTLRNLLHVHIVQKPTCNTDITRPHEDFWVRSFGHELS